jgi:hypothetical protein
MPERRQAMLKTGLRGKYALLPIVLILVATIALAAACSNAPAANQTQSSGTKLPPGASDQVQSDSSSDGSSNQGTAGQSTQAGAGASSADSNASNATTSTNSKTVSLEGVNFTVTAAYRDSSNKVVTTGNQRQISGDYLRVELSIENDSSVLMPLTDFSFRLWNPAIDASQYYAYYGSTSTYGAQVSENMISATLLDYSTLQAVTYTLKMGEKVEQLFLFYDLNPQHASQNAAFNKQNSNLVIYDTTTGSKVEVNLAGFPDQ